MKTKPSGFSLIEILLVIAIIAILTGLILTATQRSQLRAYDNSVRSSIRQMRILAEKAYNTQQYTYLNWATTGTGYNDIAPELTILKKDIDKNLGVDPDDVTYQTVIVDTASEDYCISAPLRATANYFCADATGVFKETSAACNPAVTPPRCPAS